ncbi:uncharacterized protein LOC134727502 [Mytilus trossulus]|uniref:uncharacterized protein LOC134727502 n=1 Tax=Mytilus trossulus TaxID=6551 RepID=UPI0030079815
MPPDKNVFYRKYNSFCDVFDILQVQIESLYNIGTVAVLGDLNGRVGLKPDYLLNDFLDPLLQDNISFIDYENDRQDFVQRHSEETKAPNSFGQRILQLCKSSGLRICNGRFGEDSGKITFNNKNGCSVIDYLLLSENMFKIVKSFNVGMFTSFSCHAPLSVQFYLRDNTVNLIKDQCSCSNHVYNTFKWRKKCEDDVRESLLSNAQQFEDLLTNKDENSDTNICVDELNKLLSDIFEQFTKSEIRHKKYCDICTDDYKQFKTTTDKPWFTDECKNLYNAYQQALGSFNKYRSNENRLSLNLAKQKYKWLENKLKRQYKNQRGNMMASLKRTNPKQFYRKFKKRKKVIHSNITLEQFEEHFKKLTSNPDIHPQDLSGENTGTVFDELDSPFTETELDDGIKKLKRDKSTGYDNMMNEYIIMSKHFIKPVLCKIFNCILTNGDFPELWVKSIIIPVLKKGDVNQPGNFRGISLVSHIGKLFTTLINARLTKWSRNHDVLTDAQFGFRPGYGTTDAIFALNSLISKSLRSGKRFYCCFVDYKTAFDSVTHMKLWLRLIRLGVTETEEKLKRMRDGI